MTLPALVHRMMQYGQYMDATHRYGAARMGKEPMTKGEVSKAKALLRDGWRLDEVAGELDVGVDRLRRFL